MAREAAPEVRSRSDRGARLFVGVELDDAWRGWLVEVAARLRRANGDDFRWVRPDLLHLTVVFLGQQPASCLPTIHGVIARAAARSTRFELRPGRLGSFGGRMPRAIWVGALDVSGGLSRLHGGLASELDVSAVSYDRKPLVPHITLARARRGRPGPRSWSPPDVGGDLLPPPSLLVSHLTLFESLTLEARPQYPVLQRTVLGGSGPPA